MKERRGMGWMYVLAEIGRCFEADSWPELYVLREMSKRELGEIAKRG